MAWNKVAVVGAGLIKMGELFDQSYEQMAAGAFDAAVASVDKGFEPHQVDAAFVATQRGTLWGQEGIGGNTIPTAIGLNGIPCTRIENACPSGSDAFRVGAMAVASGVHDVVLVIGVEKMRDKSTEEGLLSAPRPAIRSSPAARRRRCCSRRSRPGTCTSSARRARCSPPVAVKNHYNGARDPYAHFQNEITIEDVLKSAPVCHPLHLLDCCPQTDGAAAVLLVPAERAHEFTDRPVYVAGFGVATDHPYLHEKDSFVEIKATRLAARVRDGGRGSRPDRLAEVHDCFTITEILDIEDLGFFEKGDGGPREPRRRDLADRPDPGEHVGRAARQGPPDRRHGRRADHRVLVAAARRGRRTPGRDPQRLRAPAQRRRPRLGRVGRQHPHEPERRTTGDRDAPRGPERRSRRDGVPTAWRIVLDRPDAKNALTIAMRDGIIEAVRDFRTDPKVRAVLITGDGDGFCAGMDLSASTVAQAGKPGFVPRTTSEALRVGVQTLIRELWELDKPTIAAVNGTAVGPGAHLALACDFVFVHPRTRFIWTFAKWGLVADAGGAYLLPRLVGLPRAKAMIMLGEGATGADAVDLGLAYKCVDRLISFRPRST